MYLIKINIFNREVYLKENFGSFYTYTHNIQDAKQLSTLDSAEAYKKNLVLSVLEKSEIANIEDILKEKYFVNTFTLKIESIKTDIKYPHLYADLKEALNIFNIKLNDYDGVSYTSDSSDSSDAGEGDGTGESSSGEKEEEIP